MIKIHFKVVYHVCIYEIKIKFVTSLDVSNECRKELTIEVYDQHNIEHQTEVPIKSMKYYLIITLQEKDQEVVPFLFIRKDTT